MLDQPITVGNLIVINVATILPIIALLAKGVWYLAKMTHQHDQMWEWFSGWGGAKREGRDRREESIPVYHERRGRPRE